MNTNKNYDVTPQEHIMDLYAKTKDGNRRNLSLYKSARILAYGGYSVGNDSNVTYCDKKRFGLFVGKYCAGLRYGDLPCRIRGKCVYGR